MKDTFEIKAIFAIGGLSESGKSSVGKFLESKGVPRLKFVSFFREIMEKTSPGSNFDEWQKRTIEENPDWLWNQFVVLFQQKLETEQIAVCAIESLYRPGLAQAMRDHFGRKSVVVFVDIPQNVRLERQMIRQNLNSLEEARQFLLPRDEDKLKWGALKIKEMADVVVENSGNLADLSRECEKLLAKYS